jgi:DNA replication protein DnaC
MKAIYSQSNIPKKYQFDKKLDIDKAHVDYNTFVELRNYQMDVVGKVAMGEGLYIWSGTTGNGKTTWATKIANYFIRKTIFTGEFEDIVMYINVPTFFEKLRQSYSDESLVQEVTLMKQRLLSAKLAIFDDIGAEKPSEWVKERLYEIINYRDNEELTTIYTSNIPLNHQKEILGSRIWSRIKGHTEVMELKGGDKR